MYNDSILVASTIRSPLLRLLKMEGLLESFLNTLCLPSRGVALSSTVKAARRHAHAQSYVGGSDIVPDLEVEKLVS